MLNKYSIAANKQGHLEQGIYLPAAAVTGSISAINCDE
jgi:hypothetical protein